MGILSLLLLLPLPALGFLLVVPRAMADRWAYRLSLGSCWGQLGVLAIGILPQYVQQLDRFAARGLRFALPEQLDWLSLELGDAGRLEITYFLGLDGLNILMVALSVIILLVATVASRGVTHRPRAYFALLLLLNTAMLGCFLALDLFLFYVFYELMLLPLFFLIGLWGSERGSFAALKFFLYTLFGSLFMLVVIVGCTSATSTPLQRPLSWTWPRAPARSPSP
jgi:NADH-quinone oxidoreductase subunit M